MMHLFCINKDNRKNKDNNTAPFCAAHVSDALDEEYDEITDLVSDELWEKQHEAYRERDRKKMRRMMILLEVLSLLYISTALFVGGLREHFPLTLLLVAYNIFFIGMLIYTRFKKKNAPTEPPAEETNGEDALAAYLKDPRVIEVEEKIYASLGAHADARTVDILCFEYVTKDGEEAPRENCFYNTEIKMYSDGENLCLLDLEARYELPVSSFRSLKTVRGEFALDAWNKATPCNEGEYRLYGMERTKKDEISFGVYHILALEKDGEEYGLCFPAYELPTIRELVDLPE